jgi:hypothetical protein
VIHLAENDNYHAHTKHIAIRYQFIRQTIKRNKIIIKYCPTDEMMADILTKPLPKYKAAILTQSVRIYHA